MEDFPLVSVCIPTLNAGAYLEECLKSVLEQSYPNIEIIIVDNGSSDGTMEIAGTYRQYGVSVHSEKKKGASCARNHALSLAQGTYIQFLDADDYLSADKIELQVIALKNQPGKLAVCDTLHFTGNQRTGIDETPVTKQFLFSTDDTVGFLIHLWGGEDFIAGMVQPNAWLVPSELIEAGGCWDESLTLDDDGEFFTRMILNSKGIVKTGGLNYYRKYPNYTGNLSASTSAPALASALKSIVLKEAQLLSRSDTEAARRAIYKQLLELSVQCYPGHRDAYLQVAKELGRFKNYGFTPVMGGPAINFIAKFAGWKLARRLQLLRRGRMTT